MAFLIYSCQFGSIRVWRHHDVGLPVPILQRIGNHEKEDVVCGHTLFYIHKYLKYNNYVILGPSVAEHLQSTRSLHGSTAYRKTVTRMSRDTLI